MELKPDFRALCVELDRHYYYGRHDGVAAVMAKIREALAKDSASVVTGDVLD